jgi:glucosamine-6-phosphate deaminase
MLKIVTTNTKNEAALYVAQAVLSRLRSSSNAVVGFSAGNTQIPVFEFLSQGHSRDAVSFSRLQCFHLDEYLGLGHLSPFSFSYYMKEHFMARTDVAAENVHLIDGAAADPDAMALAYEMAIRRCGGIDLQVLSIGMNGHIGFNEPGTAFSTRTHIQKLSTNTIEANRHHLPDVPPEFAITLGIGTILESKEILLLATGPAKAKAVGSFINGPITVSCPASALRLHDRVTVVLDREAACDLM